MNAPGSPPLAADSAQPAADQWLQPLRDWPGVVLQLLQHQPAVVRIVIAGVQGSAPREAGVCMLVTATQVFGTIGGGQLEWQALSSARGMLMEDSTAVRSHRIVLGGDIGQCCGGVVELWIERYGSADAPTLRSAAQAAARGPALLVSTHTASVIERRVVGDLGSNRENDELLRASRERAPPRMKRGAQATELMERLDDALLPVWLYGAGHVGQALARMLLPLPLRLTWIDSRADLLPREPIGPVQLIHSLEPVKTVAAAPPGTRFIVMTHSHSLDYSLCRAILTRADFAWAGLIGSKSKSARFRSRLARHGVDAALIARLICPIGVPGIESKWPAAIAIGVAAQLLQAISAYQAEQRIGADAQAAEQAPTGCGERSCEDCHTSHAPLK